MEQVFEGCVEAHLALIQGLLIPEVYFQRVDMMALKGEITVDILQAHQYGPVYGPVYGPLYNHGGYPLGGGDFTGRPHEAGGVPHSTVTLEQPVPRARL